jgi:hypothetical protein
LFVFGFQTFFELLRAASFCCSSSQSLPSFS